MSENQIFDSLIIGGGPAGQSAAIYLARFNRSVLVLDTAKSRTLTYELNENYLGFPQGIHARQLFELGRQQAQRFGVTFIADEAQRVVKSGDVFEVFGHEAIYHSRSLIIATGVTDLYPNLADHQQYLGKSLFWCITCDGYKTNGKRVILVGDTDEAACTAVQFLQYTSQVTLLTNYAKSQTELSPRWRQRLAKRNIPIIDGEIAALHGTNGYIHQVELASGQEIATDFVFNLQGAVPNNSLASQLGVEINQHGYIETTEDQRTNIPFVYAAGDVTRAFAHQIVTAAHEGSMAAQAANYDLYDPDQRMD